MSVSPEEHPSRLEYVGCWQSNEIENLNGKLYIVISPDKKRPDVYVHVESYPRGGERKKQYLGIKIYLESWHFGTYVSDIDSGNWQITKEQSKEEVEDWMWRMYQAKIEGIINGGQSMTV